MGPQRPTEGLWGGKAMGGGAVGPLWSLEVGVYYSKPFHVSELWLLPQPD